MAVDVKTASGVGLPVLCVLGKNPDFWVLQDGDTVFLQIISKHLAHYVT
jgi:hypothetical protein